jgi:hypothetical protein
MSALWTLSELSPESDVSGISGEDNGLLVLDSREDNNGLERNGAIAVKELASVKGLS